RAVKVSFDRPYLQPISGEGNWYVTVDQPIVGWLERSGYDVTYAASDDLERDPAAGLPPQALLSPAHHEDSSAGMRTAVTAPRRARRRRRPLLHGRERDLLEGALRARPAERRPLPGAGGVQVDRERGTRPERDPHRDLARSRGREPARERAHGRHVRRGRQRPV